MPKGETNNESLPICPKALPLSGLGHSVDCRENTESGISASFAPFP